MSYFDFDGFALRAVIVGSEPWFIAADVCAPLAIGNVSDALSRLDADERTLVSIESASNGLPVNAVSESGLYSLILGSRKPEAKRFKKWVTSEVLPAIRKTGSYSVAPVVDPFQVLNDPVAMRSLLLGYTTRLIETEAERDHAIKTKAQIGSKREATAMAVAGAAKREAAKLRDQLGFSARHATILQVEHATGGEYKFAPLRTWCKDHGVTPETVPDKRYPAGVKAWPAGAWSAVYGVDLVELFGEVAA